MRHFSISCHASLDAIAVAAEITNALRIGSKDWPEVTIFLPARVEIQPIVDAFNAAMEAAKAKQVIA